MWKDWKYLIAYVAPLAAFVGIYLQGIWSFGSIYVGFGLIPILELITPAPTDNIAPEEESARAQSAFFDFLLYLNVPILYVLIAYYFYTLNTESLALYEIIGMTFSVGLIVGTIGINVAHELGHRVTAYEQNMAKILLLPALYMHFYIEHNRGHHKNVATPEDPASARYGEVIYVFWWRSVKGSYRNAWRLEKERLLKIGQQVWSWSNEMVRFTVFQLAYLVLVGVLFNPLTVVSAIAIAIFGFLLLESVNYIEHYGLQRQKLPTGRYEKVGPQHSWNSDHELGRIFLYELTRHSDHHYKATRKYQVLRHFDESPQLPFGYPTAILTAFVPPLWFSIMNRRVQQLESP